MLNRRGFLAGILAAGVAPAAIGSGILMPVRKIVRPHLIWIGADFGTDGANLVGMRETWHTDGNITREFFTREDIYLSPQVIRPVPLMEWLGVRASDSVRPPTSQELIADLQRYSYRYQAKK